MSKLFLTVATLGILFTFNACRVNETIENEGSSSLLWKISGNNLTDTSYLYGTIHIQDKRIFAYGETVQRALDQSNQVAVEVLLDQINPASIMKVMFMQDSTLDMLLSEAEYNKLEEVYKEITGVGLATAKTMKPFFISANIIQQLAPRDMPVPLDLFFINEARKEDKDVIGLETLEEQIAIIDGLSYTAQAKMLVESMEDVDEIKAQFNELIEAYLSMDSKKVVELTEDPSMPAAFMEELLNKRNKIMVERMIDPIRTNSTFVAVGAAHLYGNDGIVALLKDKGYMVEPVEFLFDRVIQ